MRTTAILLAGGKGRRMRDMTDDKVLARLNGKPAILYSLLAFEQSGCIDDYLIVYRDTEQYATIQEILSSNALTDLDIKSVQGGAERQFSVHNALSVLGSNCSYVFIHDCARPCITVKSVQKLQKALIEDDAACLAHPVKDTIKRTPATKERRKLALQDLDRSRLWATETPQAFRYQNIFKAYQKVVKQNLSVTDDVGAAQTIGLQVTLVENEQANPKITTPADLPYIEHLLANNPIYS